MTEAAVIRDVGRAGRITLNRPKALNALTHDMVRAIDGALQGWADADAVEVVVIDGAGERAFCAGGDVADLYAAGRAGDYGGGRRFWRDEYRMNARLAAFPKPVVTLMQGYTMGGGVGVGCHASRRVVGESSRIAMPECSIGMLPDVGGSWLLAHAPGRLGEYLALTATRMGPGDAILAGFADHYIPESRWPDVIAELESTGTATGIDTFDETPPPASLTAHADRIDRLFSAPTLGEIADALAADADETAEAARRAMAGNSPLSMACALWAIRRLRDGGTVRDALELEYRFAHRVLERGDFLEGVRALIIDKDKSPRWRHTDPRAVPEADIAAMFAPLDAKDALTREDLA